PEPHNGDRRLEVVLLEEHPLQHLRPQIPVFWDEARALAEVPEDRSRLAERAAVVEHERRHTQARIELAEQLAPIRAVGDVDGLPLVGNAEVREQQPHLVAIARDRAVVEQHQTRTRGSQRGTRAQYSSYSAPNRRRRPGSSTSGK